MFPPLVGLPGWRCFLAWSGDEPAGCGALYVEGRLAWLGMAATRPSHRRRGAQIAILLARIEAARALGADAVYTETGAAAADGPGRRTGTSSAPASVSRTCERTGGRA